MPTRALFTAASFAVAVIIAAAPQPAAARSAGKVLESSGEVKVLRQGSQAGLSPGDEVGTGDRITTGGDGMVRIHLATGAVMQLGPTSSATISNQTVSSSRVRLWLGRLWSKIAPNAGKVYEVETENAVAGVRGTTFEVEATADGESVLTVVEGAVDYASSTTGQLLQVSAGTQASVKGNDPIALMPAPAADSPLDSIDPKALSKEGEDAGYKAIEDVPDDQKLAQAAAYTARMKSTLSRVLEHLTDARKGKDVVKLNCVNEKLTAVKGLLKVSEQAEVALQEALARPGDEEIAAHEFDKIAIAAQKCDQLLAESEACIGELAVYSGDTEVEVEIEGPEVTDPLSDPAVLPLLEAEAARPPIEADPFREYDPNRPDVGTQFQP